MPDEHKVIGCTFEDTGDELCEDCRGGYYDSPECKIILKGEEYQLIYVGDSSD